MGPEHRYPRCFRTSARNGNPTNGHRCIRCEGRRRSGTRSHLPCRTGPVGHRRKRRPPKAWTAELRCARRPTSWVPALCISLSDPGCSCRTYGGAHSPPSVSRAPHCGSMTCRRIQTAWAPSPGQWSSHQRRTHCTAPFDTRAATGPFPRRVQRSHRQSRPPSVVGGYARVASPPHTCVDEREPMPHHLPCTNSSQGTAKPPVTCAAFGRGLPAQDSLLVQQKPHTVWLMGKQILFSGRRGTARGGGCLTPLRPARALQAPSCLHGRLSAPVMRPVRRPQARAAHVRL